MGGQEGDVILLSSLGYLVVPLGVSGHPARRGVCFDCLHRTFFGTSSSSQLVQNILTQSSSYRPTMRTKPKASSVACSSIQNFAYYVDSWVYLLLNVFISGFLI